MSANNIFPIKEVKSKSDRFNVHKVEITAANQIAEGPQVGHAFMKPGSNKFHLILWMLDRNKYYVLPKDASRVEYDILNLKEIVLPNGDKKQIWNKVGDGLYFGNYLKLNFYLLHEELFMSLHPSNKKWEDSNEKRA